MNGNGVLAAFWAILAVCLSNQAAVVRSHPPSNSKWRVVVDTPIHVKPADQSLGLWNRKQKRWVFIADSKVSNDIRIGKKQKQTWKGAWRFALPSSMEVEGCSGDDSCQSSSNRPTPSQSYTTRDWSYSQVLLVDVDMSETVTGDDDNRKKILRQVLVRLPTRTTSR
ncbi:unnamed protein product [Linum trigynum]|uniref:Uncharacterized protein n=1 Tax=Linum trigynum TaxID=586398 RepID=A0AAV2CXW2_9ROSI